jgi:hypothetical protein
VIDFVQQGKGGFDPQPTDEEASAAVGQVSEVVGGIAEEPDIINDLIPDWLIAPGSDADQRLQNTIADIEACEKTINTASTVGGIAGGLLGLLVGGGPIGAALLGAAGSAGATVQYGGACAAIKGAKRRKEEKNQPQGESTVSDFLSFFGIQSDEVDEMAAQQASSSRVSSFAIEARPVELARLEQRKKDRQSAKQAANVQSLALLSLAALGAYKLYK